MKREDSRKSNEWLRAFVERHTDDSAAAAAALDDLGLQDEETRRFLQPILVRKVAALRRQGSKVVQLTTGSARR